MSHVAVYARFQRTRKQIEDTISDRKGFAQYEDGGWTVGKHPHVAVVLYQEPGRLTVDASVLRKIRRKLRWWQPRIELAVDVLLFEQTGTPLLDDHTTWEVAEHIVGKLQQWGKVVIVDHVTGYMKVLK